MNLGMDSAELVRLRKGLTVAEVENCVSASGIMNFRSFSGMILTGETDVLGENLSAPTLSTTVHTRSALGSNRSFIDLVLIIKL